METKNPHFCSQARKTGKDTFLMGPSGYGFLHPAAIASNDSLLDKFVNETVADAEQLGMTGYVHWDIDDNGLTQRWAHLSIACWSSLH